MDLLQHLIAPVVTVLIFVLVQVYSSGKVMGKLDSLVDSFADLKTHFFDFHDKVSDGELVHCKNRGEQISKLEKRVDYIARTLGNSTRRIEESYD